eukprot:TRINITY_DN4837_c0_g1_i2.p1 TRINITY_DN4837_c0_g1~~TRINITY_DN4837_c0_g1_i2.p1  ORF type:complete len:728 (+),score=209.03 TRINITY_DN4837_c0_g1_i2:28-2184(+)
MPSTLIKADDGSYPPPIPDDEEERLALLHSFHLIDEDEPQIAFDDITRIASHVCQTPIAMISLVDRDTVYIKATVGMGVPQGETGTGPRSTSFCGHVITTKKEEVIQVPDTSKDDRFSTNPHVANPAGLGLKFYAGAALIAPENRDTKRSLPSSVGTLCVADTKCRVLSDTQQSALLSLSRLVVDQMEFKKRNEVLRETLAERDRAQDQLDLLNQQLSKRNKELEEQILSLKKDQSILDTPAEKVIAMLKELKADVSQGHASTLDFIIDVVGSHKLYKVDVNNALEKDTTIDTGIKDFLLTQFESKAGASIQDEFADQSVRLAHTNRRGSAPLQHVGRSNSAGHLASILGLNSTTSTSSSSASHPPPAPGSKDGHLETMKEVNEHQLQPDRYRAAFEGHEGWGFDIFKFARETDDHPLLYMVYYLFEEYDMFDQIPELDQTKLINFITAIEDGYVDNPYHNRTHAADVVHGCYFFLKTSLTLSPYLSLLEIMAAIIACAIHDYRHPGRNNVFLINTEDKLAVRHNDLSVLENFHCSEAWEVLKRKENNFLAELPLGSRQMVRKIVVGMVLATDMAKHPEILAQFQNKMHTASLDVVSSFDDRLLALRMAIKCADISNPARPLPVYQGWVDRVMEEFYRQGDAERILTLPISAFMDRNLPDQVPKCQSGFIGFIVLPTYKSWVEFAGLTEPLQILENNLKYWKDKIEVQQQQASTTSSS